MAELMVGSMDRSSAEQKVEWMGLQRVDPTVLSSAGSMAVLLVHSKVAQKVGKSDACSAAHSVGRLVRCSGHSLVENLVVMSARSLVVALVQC